MTTLLIIGLTFVAMEPATYAAHRWLMHGPAMGWHRSHHRPAGGRVERNDLFPVVFAAVGLAVSAVGATVGSLEVLLAVSIGAGLYGAAYLFVHDLCIHRRLGPLGPVSRSRLVARLAAAHRIHHLFGGEPYGMLVPVVPAALRARAATADRDALGRGAADRMVQAVPASGSLPSQVPAEP